MCQFGGSLSLLCDAVKFGRETSNDLFLKRCVSSALFVFLSLFVFVLLGFLLRLSSIRLFLFRGSPLFNSFRVPFTSECVVFFLGGRSPFAPLQWGSPLLSTYRGFYLFWLLLFFSFFLSFFFLPLSLFFFRPSFIHFSLFCFEARGRRFTNFHY